LKITDGLIHGLIARHDVRGQVFEGPDIYTVSALRCNSEVSLNPVQSDAVVQHNRPRPETCA
jgi:hypothetical protein